MSNINMVNARVSDARVHMGGPSRQMNIGISCSFRTKKGADGKVFLGSLMLSAEDIAEKDIEEKDLIVSCVTNAVFETEDPVDEAAERDVVIQCYDTLFPVAAENLCVLMQMAGFKDFKYEHLQSDTIRPEDLQRQCEDNNSD